MQEETAHPTHERAVYGCGSTTEESEGVVAEMRHGWIGMVEVSEHDNPVVCEGIRDKVILDESR